MRFDVAILGGGAAGMMAAVAMGGVGEASGGKLRVGMLEKNVRPGIKVLVCGGGRCNFTNAGSRAFLIGQFGRDGRFLTPALEAMDNQGLRDFFAGLGVPSHVEPGGKVYPDSNQARSVVDALVRRMGELGVEVFAGAGSAAAEVRRVEGDLRADGARFEMVTADGRVFSARSVVMAVGGMSYQRMGTVGDGYRMLRELGHTIQTTRPAIVGLLTKEEWVKELKGLAVRDVEVKIEGAGRTSVGDMLFTHFGLSGPAVLNPSETAAELLESRETVELRIDFARHLTHEGLHGILRRWQREAGKKRVKSMLAHGGKEIIITSTSPDQTGLEDESERDGREIGLPGRLAEMICRLEEIGAEQTCATLTSEQMHRLVERLKGCVLTATGTRGFKEAMVTGGGVKLSEVNPRTMESKIVPGLYLTGEVLDLTGPSGGYNLQLAFSTGYLAGVTIGRLAGVKKDHENSKTRSTIMKMTEE